MPKFGPPPKSITLIPQPQQNERRDRVVIRVVLDCASHAIAGDEAPRLQEALRQAEEGEEERARALTETPRWCFTDSWPADNDFVAIQR